MNSAGLIGDGYLPSRAAGSAASAALMLSFVKFLRPQPAWNAACKDSLQVRHSPRARARVERRQRRLRCRIATASRPRPRGAPPSRLLRPH